MSAQAAVHSGAGLVTVVSDEKNHGALHARLPEAMAVDWQDTAAVDAQLASADVLLIGPGLGIEHEGQQLLERALRSQTQDQWLIIDGSAIPLYASGGLRINYPEHVIFTPHQHEWQTLSGIPIAQQTDANNEQARQKLHAFVVVKSHRTKIYTPSGKSYLNPLGTPAMATGGMGDTLAGIIAGFIAQFPDKERALCASVYLHSRIGEDLSHDHYVVLPTKIAEQLPRYMKRYEQR